MVFFPSSPLPGYSIVLVLLLVALDHCARAQNATFINILLGGLDDLGLTKFTSVVRQVNADPAQITFSLSLSDSTTPKTLFVPNNDACEFSLILRRMLSDYAQSLTQMSTLMTTPIARTTQDSFPLSYCTILHRANIFRKT